MITTHASYDPTYFALLFAIEDRHFWFRTRNRVIATLVSQITAGLAPGYRVLEIGCGTGNVLRVLEQTCRGGTVVGMDLFAEGLQYSRQRTSCSLVQGDMHTLPFGIPFDLIGVFDLLEHLPDDMQLLRDLRAMLAPEGVLLLTVPAHPVLWSYFDEASHHCRRYTLSELNSKLLETGYDVVYITEYMMSIFPLVWIGRYLAQFRNGVSRRRGSVSVNELAMHELRPMPILNEVLALLLNAEGCILARGHTLPFGTSLLVVARESR